MRKNSYKLHKQASANLGTPTYIYYVEIYLTCLDLRPPHSQSGGHQGPETLLYTCKLPNDILSLGFIEHNINLLYRSTLFAIYHVCTKYMTYSILQKHYV